MMWTTKPWSTTGGPFFCWEDSCERSLFASNEKCNWAKIYPLHCLRSVVRFSAVEINRRQGAFYRTGFSFDGDLVAVLVSVGIRFSICASATIDTVLYPCECNHVRNNVGQGTLNRMRVQLPREFCLRMRARLHHLMGRAKRAPLSLIFSS